MKNPHLWRYATQKFNPQKEIPKETLQRLLEALRLAPSSYGLQPWKFIVVQNEMIRSQLRQYAWDQPQITDASVLIVLCAKPNTDASHIKNFLKEVAKIRSVSLESLSGYEKIMVATLQSFTVKELAEWTKYQVYLALGILLAECAHEEVDACPIEGFNSAQFDEILNLKEEGVQSTVLCAVGYRAEDDHYATLPKVRFEKKDIIIFK